MKQNEKKLIKLAKRLIASGGRFYRSGSMDFYTTIECSIKNENNKTQLFIEDLYVYDNKNYSDDISLVFDLDEINDIKDQNFNIEIYINDIELDATFIDDSDYSYPDGYGDAAHLEDLSYNYSDDYNDIEFEVDKQQFFNDLLEKLNMSKEEFYNKFIKNDKIMNLIQDKVYSYGKEFDGWYD